MRHSLPSIVGGSLLAAILILYMITFQVRFSEVAVVRTFGKISESGEVTEPGLYWKWPWPIQKVDKYDHRIQISSTTGEETPTRDGKTVIVTTTICWRIEDPYKFSTSCRTLRDGEESIKSRVRNDQKTVISQYDFTNFVSTDPKELKYDEIEQEIASTIQPIADDLYGVQIERVAIEAFVLPQQTTESVIEAMRKERAAIAQRYTSEGESQARQIKDTAESIAGTIMAFADRKAQEIIAEGQQRAIQYNEVFRKDEALATFLLQVENIPKIVGERATLVLDQPMFVDFFQAAQQSPLANLATRPAGEGRTSLESEALVPLLDETK